MLSVLIYLPDDHARLLAATLTALVPAAVDGLVRDVVVIAADAMTESSRVAEHAGCELREARELEGVLASARGEWVLLLQAGAEPQPGWIDATARHLAREARAGRFRPARDRSRWFGSMFAGRRSALGCGVLVGRAKAVEIAARTADLPALARAIRTRPIEATIRSPRN